MFTVQHVVSSWAHCRATLHLADKWSRIQSLNFLSLFLFQDPVRVTASPDLLWIWQKWPMDWCQVLLHRLHSRLTAELLTIMYISVIKYMAVTSSFLPLYKYWCYSPALSCYDPTQNLVIKKCLQGYEKLKRSTDTRLSDTEEIPSTLVETLVCTVTVFFRHTLHKSVYLLAFHASLTVGEMTETSKLKQS